MSTDTSTLLSLLALITTILAVALTVVTGLVGYRATRIPKEVREQVEARVGAIESGIRDRVGIRMELLDDGLETLLQLVESESGHVVRGSIATELHILRQLLRLASEDPDEAELAADALYAMQGRSDHKLLVLIRLHKHLPKDSAAARRIQLHLSEVEARLQRQVLPDS